MPAQSLKAERYVVYSVDTPEDLKSNSSGSRESITFTSPEYVDLALRKLPNGHGNDIQYPSPVPSTPTTDKWGSYWSTRERCCCFWNFIMFVALVVLVTIVVLVTKGMMDLRKPDKDSTTTNEKFLSADVTLTAVTCASPKPAPSMCTDDECLRLTTDILKYMNLSVDPCEDFYTYACGGFTNTATVTWTSPRKRINPDVIVQKHFEVILDAVSEDINKVDSKETAIIKTVFQSCIKHTNTQLSQVEDLLDELGGFEWSSSGPKDMTKPMTLTKLIAETATRFGTFVLFDVDVSSDMSLAIYNRFSDKMIQTRLDKQMAVKRYRFLKPSDYIYRDENKDEILQAYRTYMGDFLGYILGINATMRVDRRYLDMINDIYHLDVYINRVFYTEDSGNLSDGMTKCPNKLTIDDLQYQFSYNISWRELFNTVFVYNNPMPKHHNICCIALNNALSEILSGFSFKTVKQYVLYSLLVNSDLYTLLPLETPVFKMPQWQGSAFTINNGQSMSRDDSNCVHFLSNYIPVSHVIQSRIPRELDDKMRSLFSELVSSLEGIISDMYWVPLKQKRHLLTSLSDLEIQFDWIKENSVFRHILRNVTSDFFHNAILMLRYDSDVYLHGFKQRIYSLDDLSVFKLNSRILDVPRLVLQVPMVHTSSFPSTWYGGTGTLLSQTISQLFDIDALLRFLTEDKIDHRVALTIAFRLQCLVDEYNKYVVFEDVDRVYKVKSDITKSANFGDSLALRVAYNSYTKHRNNKALPKLPGMSFNSDQLFFLTYAQTMCEKTNKRGIFKHYIDNTESHQSPGKFRVLGTLSNFKKFSEAFSCDVNTKMNPQDKCTLF